MDYISAKEAATRWGVSERSVHQYCKDKRIPGVQRFGRSWAIPKDAIKPIDQRKKATSAQLENTVQESSKVGALIIASDEFSEENSPLRKLGSSSLIRRIVVIFQQAHVSPIVVVTGYQSLELEHHLSNYGVIFVHNENYATTDKYQSVKMGLEFIKDKCDKVFFTSVKRPMFVPKTLKDMAKMGDKAVIPEFQGKNGHPLLLDSSIIDQVASYEGDRGMRGALRAANIKRKHLKVEDEGVLLSVADIDRLEALTQWHDENLLHPFLRISIEKNRVIFDERGELLLSLIRDVGSIQGACKQMALSRAKAWDMINSMEKELGFTVVERQRGGSRQRSTKLTEEGEKFLEFYQVFESSVTAFAREEFKRCIINVFSQRR